MPEIDEKSRADFHQAMGESFGDYVCPPVPFEDASAHECCEVVSAVVGFEVTPGALAAITEEQILALSEKFGQYFGSSAPSVDQVKKGIAATLRRWPVGSLGE